MRTHYDIIFEDNATEQIALLRSVIAAGETGRIRREAHALKGASLSIGARGMAHICQQLENLGTLQTMEGAPLRELLEDEKRRRAAQSRAGSKVADARLWEWFLFIGDRALM